MPLAIGVPPSDERLNGYRWRLTTSGREAMRKTTDIFKSAALQAHDELIFGPAVPYVPQYARDGHHDLPAIGSRGAGSGPTNQILLGGIAGGFLGSTGCMVLLVTSNGK